MGPPLTPDSVPSALSPGTRFGAYEILEQLGSGGMGEVYRARDTRLGREVAIKTVSLQHNSQPEALTRFELEARSASALNHPNIVTIYELGCVDNTHFIAMELVCGETVRQLLASGPIAFRKAIAIAAQVADALARAHEIGIVHRDLKPDNLMVSVDGAAKVLDFGLAKLLALEPSPDAEASTSISKDGAVMGTLGYMSPEQANGSKLDFRSDQFSFGSVLYEMVTGVPAFQKKHRCGNRRCHPARRAGADRIPDASGARSVHLDCGAMSCQGPTATLLINPRFGPRPGGGARPPGGWACQPCGASPQ